jgi:hypothetical protein
MLGEFMFSLPVTPRSRDHGVVGRRSWKIDIDPAVRALTRVERRGLIEVLLVVIAVSWVALILAPQAMVRSSCPRR